MNIPDPSYLNGLLEEREAAYKQLHYHTQSLGGGLQSISPSLFLDTLSGLVAKTQGILDYLLNNNPTEVVTTNIKDYVDPKAVAGVKWSRMDEVVGFKPGGLSSRIDQFVEFLTGNSDDMAGCQTALRAANKTFSGYISDPASLNKFDGIGVPTITSLDELVKSFGNYFTDRQGIDRNAMSSLYPNLNEYHQASQRLAILTKTFGSVTTADIKKDMDRLNETLGYLREAIKSNPISKNVALDIGNIVYTLADWVALFSIFVTRLVSTNKAHLDNGKVLLEQVAEK